MGASLRQFLARLSIDHSYLRDFIKEPEKMLANAGLTASERAAMLSRDQTQIQLSLIEDLPTSESSIHTPAPANRAPLGSSQMRSSR